MEAARAREKRDSGMIEGTGEDKAGGERGGKRGTFPAGRGRLGDRSGDSGSTGVGAYG